jgi:L-rhamnose isomerase
MLHAWWRGKKYQLIVFDLTLSWLEPTNYLTQGEHANHYTSYTVLCKTYIEYPYTAIKKTIIIYPYKK